MNKDEKDLDLSGLSNYEIYEIKETLSTIYFYEIGVLSKGNIIYECFKRRSVKTRIISNPQKVEIEIGGEKYEAWDWKAEILEVYDYKWDRDKYKKVRVDSVKKEQEYRFSNVPCQGQPNLYSEDVYQYLIGEK